MGVTTTVVCLVLALGIGARASTSTTTAGTTPYTPDACSSGEALNVTAADTKFNALYIFNNLNANCNGTLTSVTLYTNSTGKLYLDIYTAVSEYDSSWLYSELLTITSAGFSTFSLSTSVFLDSNTRVGIHYDSSHSNPQLATRTIGRRTTLEKLTLTHTSLNWTVGMNVTYDFFDNYPDLTPSIALNIAETTTVAASTTPTTAATNASTTMDSVHVPSLLMLPTLLVSIFTYSSIQ